jgi:hypothetical protein
MVQANGTFTDPLLNDLSCHFAAHAAIYRGTSKQNASPLYAHLSQLIATDAEILQLVSDADRATQVSNLLFGAVHFLLLRGARDPLADFYASLTPANDYAEQGHEQPRAERSHSADTLTRVIAPLHAQSAQVTFRRASKITLATLVQFYQDLQAAYPDAERIYVVQDNWPVHTYAFENGKITSADLQYA